MFRRVDHLLNCYKNYGLPFSKMEMASRFCIRYFSFGFEFLRWFLRRRRRRSLGAFSKWGGEHGLLCGVYRVPRLVRSRFSYSVTADRRSLFIGRAPMRCPVWLCYRLVAAASAAAASTATASATAASVVTSASAGATVAVQKEDSDKNDPEALVVLENVT